MASSRACVLTVGTRCYCATRLVHGKAVVAQPRETRNSYFSRPILIFPPLLLLPQLLPVHICCHHARACVRQNKYQRWLQHLRPRNILMAAHISSFFFCLVFSIYSNISAPFLPFPTRSELPLSERLRVVANEVATVEKLNRSNTRRKLHAAHDKGQEPGSKDPSKGPVHRGAGADGGGQTADAGSGASVQHANVGHADEAATAADGLAAAVAAVKEAPEKNKKKMAVRRQTRDSQPEAANETCMQRTKRYALTTFGLQTIFSILLLLIGLVYLTQRLQWTWQYSLYWCMMTALTVGQCKATVVRLPGCARVCRQHALAPLVTEGQHALTPPPPPPPPPTYADACLHLQ